MSVIEQRQQREVTAPQSPVAEPVTVADVLTRAADLLGEFGWTQQGVGSKAEGEMCMIGACVEAAKDLGRNGWSIALDNVGVGRTGESIGGWNDAPGRTKAEVVAKLREAAEAARA